VQELSQAPSNGHSNPDQAQVYIQEGFQWDTQEAYLFDIDGTLLRSHDRIHFDSFAHGIRQVYGQDVTMDGVMFHGSTDPGILRDAFRNAGVADEVFQPLLGEICQAMCETVANRRHEMKLTMMPGVKEVLQYLDSKGASLGIGTGNLEAIGWLKIENLGLRHWFRFGGFSDKFDVRAEMIAHAADEARELAGSNATVCIVGDTPADIEAARANSLPTIAVATGHYSVADLMQHNPEVCCTNLAALMEKTVREREKHL
jgi:phosphoglycolate phosphatase